MKRAEEYLKVKMGHQFGELQSDTIHLLNLQYRNMLDQVLATLRVYTEFYNETKLLYYSSFLCKFILPHLEETQKERTELLEDRILPQDARFFKRFYRLSTDLGLGRASDQERFQLRRTT